MKRYDDYLPRETRAQYVERRAKENNQRGHAVMFWPTFFTQSDGSRTVINGTLAKNTT